MGNLFDYLRSDYCTVCDGNGYRIEKTASCPATGNLIIEYEQCEECEELHEQERRSDLQHDIDKGN